MHDLTLTPGEMTLAQLRRVHAEPVTIELDDTCKASIHSSAQLVSHVLRQDRPVST